MSAVVEWGTTTLLGSTVLMLLVLALRSSVRRWLGARLAYALWALPAVRLLVPVLPDGMLTQLSTAGNASTRMLVMAVGPRAALDVLGRSVPASLGDVLVGIWLAGALGLFAIYATRHVVFCHRLRADSTGFGRVGGIRVVAADVEGPLAFGVFRRFIAVPLDFAHAYDADERALALAHECAHHARGDLVANWTSLTVLAAHWWNPVAWIAIRAFRDDQECAADAHVLAASGPGALPLYARVLAKAAGIGALPACNLNARSNLKGRLMMLGQQRGSRRRLVFGAAALTLLGSTAVAATVPTPGASGSATGTQVVTIGVKPDGSGGYKLIVGGTSIAPGAALPDGRTLPADFSGSGGCDLKPAAKPFAMAIKGAGRTQTYTVMCASAAPAPIRVTLAEGLASLNTMRSSVATQQASASFPEAERTHALGAIDRSIREVEATLATLG